MNLSGDSRAHQSGSHEPVRTCVGCRTRAARSDLMRVVLDGDRVVVDSTGTLPGRGAWLHPSPECVAQAHRRRSIGRALRSPSADTSGVTAPVA